MTVTLTTQTIIELKNNLRFQLAYGHPGQKEGEIYLKDIRNMKLQYCLDKNLEILQKETARVEKITGISELYEELQKKHEKEIKNLKTENAKKKIAEKTDQEFFEKKMILLKDNPEFEIELFELKMEIPDVDRAGFWVLKHFVSQEENK